MLRMSLLVVACLGLFGCRSPYGCNPFAPCGARVPPPGTGTYGAPNTYYPGATVGPASPASMAPSLQTQPRVIQPLGTWHSVPDTGAASVATQANGTTSPVSTSSLPAADQPPQLNGMRINEARPAAAPGIFQTQGPVSNLNNPPPNLSAPQRPASGFTSQATPAAAKVWKTRPEPTTQRVAGNYPVSGAD